MKNALLCVLVLCSIPAAVHAQTELDPLTTDLLQHLRFQRGGDIVREERLAELRDVEERIEQELSLVPDDPVLWFLKGLHAWNMIYTLSGPLTDEEQRLKDHYRNEVSSAALERAMELDRGRGHLTVDMLYTVRRFGPSEAHVAASQRIIDEGPYLEPGEELEIRAGMAVHYVDLNRFDAALRMFDEFEDRYPGQLTSDLEFKRNQVIQRNAAAREAEATREVTGGAAELAGAEPADGAAAAAHPGPDSAPSTAEAPPSSEAEGPRNPDAAASSEREDSARPGLVNERNAMRVGIGLLALVLVAAIGRRMSRRRAG